MSRFFHPKFKALSPYAPGEQPLDRPFVKLNTNESPFPPAPGVLEAVTKAVPRLNLYPDNNCAGLRNAMAARYQVESDQVFLGNGSDEILAFCFQGFCPDGAAYADISYGFYPVYAQFYQIKSQVIPLAEDFTVRPNNYVGLEKTIFIANPNAPTGLALPRDEIASILHWNRSSLVVVDEAYVDFGAESVVPLVNDYDNLLVVGTFSKSRSLAGGRLGYAIGNSSVISDLKLIKYSFNPYNINSLTQAAATAAVQDEDYFCECTRKIIKTRAHAQQVLRKMGFFCTDSSANFIFATHPKIPAEQIHHRLRDAGVLVRWFNKPRISNHLRITVGSDQEMEILYEALDLAVKTI